MGRHRRPRQDDEELRFHRRPGRRGGARADPGRGRHQRRAAGLPRRGARALRPLRRDAGLRRDPVRHGPHREDVRLRARRRRARPHGARQGLRRRRHADRRHRRAPPKTWERYIENPFLHTTTFGGNPVCCAAAIATIGVLLDEDLPRQAGEKGEYLLRGSPSSARRYPNVLKVGRGRGLMLGLEFADDELGYAVAKNLFARQILIGAPTSTPTSCASSRRSSSAIRSSTGSSPRSTSRWRRSTRSSIL